MTTAINIDNVVKNYGNFQALKGVSFSIEQGEFFGLLGPNGAGKSTLINTMAGLTRASSGTIQIQGHDVVSDYRLARKHIGVVPQEIAFDPFFTVKEALELQTGYMGIKVQDNQKWISELLETLDLSHKADSRVKQLSGGMKRRVLIAQALVHRPPVVVLDEPTAGVDVELRQILWAFAEDLHKQGHTIVLTTHYLEEAESLCERIAILNHGELQALDTKDELMNRHPFRFLTVWVDENVECPEVLQKNLVCNHQGKWQFKLNKSSDDMAAVLAAIQSHQIQIKDIETENPGLEEVFVEMTKRGEK